ncbi:MAG: allophanate hydrolase [Hyphomicrobium sp.]
MTFSLNISSLIDGYVSRRFTPSDVIAEVYRRIEAHGERPTWISLRAKADALQRAEDAPEGPLHGIPFAVKDNIDVAGLQTTCACPDFAYPPARSAFAVERLEAAGAIVIGKTNLDQFATGLVGVRSPYGIPSCVFNADYISGGSSSGSAVAVAGGLVSFALGTDTAGSGRVPAAFNNIVGLKPTKGIVSAHGVVPACRSQDTVSVFALTVADAQFVYKQIAAFDAEDAFARRQPGASAYVSARPRIGIPGAPLEFFGDDAAVGLYADAIACARSLGAEIVEIDFTPFADAARLLYSGPWVAERLAAIKTFAATHPASLHPVVGEIILGGGSLSAVDAFEGFYRLADCARAAEAQWRAMDMLLLPTAPTIYRIADVLADPIRLNSNLGLYTNFVNLMDLSALAVPAGFRDDGLPFGVTFIAPAFADAAIAEFGDRLHRAASAVRLGASAHRLDATPKFDASGGRSRAVQVAVVGAHLSGQPLNAQLQERNARLLRRTRTSQGYSFYALAGTVPAKPGLVFDGTGAGGIEVEIWEMDEAAFGSFVAMIPPPLAIGTVALADGGTVKGFVCEGHAVDGARDITSFGGWRNYLSGGGREQT